MKHTLLHDDVVFLSPAADPSSYAKYGATVIVSGAGRSSDHVNNLRRQGLRVAGSMWCLTAQSHDLHAYPELASAVARDIAGEPIAIAALAPASGSSAPRYYGCVNHPAFRAHMRRKVCDAMACGVDGLHVDEHLGSAAALTLGGCFCDFCMAGFAGYLAKLGDPALARTAKVSSFDSFDYRSFVKTFAPTREHYLSPAASIPLWREFTDFQLASAASNTASLGKLAQDIAQRPVTLSANLRLPATEHTVVVPHLSYCASEVAHNAAAGETGLAGAINAYRAAEALGIPMAATATPEDWAFVKNSNAEQLVCLWIALAYACGQRFMAPNRMPCGLSGGAADWFCGSASTFSPLYAFVKKHGFLLNDFSPVGPLARPEGLPSSFETSAKRNALAAALDSRPPLPLSAGNAWVFPRVKNDGTAAVHVVNHSYNAVTRLITPLANVEVRLPDSIFNRSFSGGTVYSYGAEPMKLTVRNEGNTSVMVLPEVKLWSIVRFEYWA
ncbi:MAG TPA: hypothetical protein VKF42_07780 [Chitinivibrionales bacterium]|jgi:hypothetical protein|nr:hypothetical protein [Chitinivibrionales bacterium]